MPQFPFPGEYLKMINIHFSAQADAVLRPLGLTLAQSDVLLFLDQRGGEETTLAISRGISGSNTRPWSGWCGGWRTRAS